MGWSHNEAPEMTCGKHESRPGPKMEVVATEYVNGQLVAWRYMCYQAGCYQTKRRLAKPGKLGEQLALPVDD